MMDKQSKASLTVKLDLAAFQRKVEIAQERFTAGYTTTQIQKAVAKVAKRIERESRSLTPY